MSAAPDQAPRPGNTRYSAFISYSHAADGDLAKTVQNALQQLNKPWFKLRARRVFRDQTGLALTPALWEAIERALADSSHLILFASPASAQSEWVRKELDWWLQHRSAERLFIVWTEGQLTREATGADYDWSKTNALPDVLAGRFRSTPLYLDLRWARDQKELSLRHPRFADAMAQITASLEGVTPDEVISEDIRQHRKAMRLLRATGIFLAAVTVAALATSFIALKLGQRVSPLVLKEQQAAQLQASENESRRLAALSLQSADKELAVLLAAAAAETQPTPEAESALRRSLAGESKARLTFPGDATSIAYCTFSPDGARVLTWHNGSTKLYDATMARLLMEFGASTNRAQHAAFSKDGTRIHTTGEDGSVSVWETATGVRLLELKEAAASAALMSPDGTRILTVVEGRTATLWDAATGNKIKEMEYSQHMLLSDEIRDAAFSPDSSRLAICGILDAKILDARTGTELKKLEDHAKPISSIVFSANGEWLITASEDATIRRWRTASGQCEKVIEHNQKLFDAKISPNGGLIAAREQSQGILIWNAETGARFTRLEIGASSDAPVLHTFSPNGRCVMTASYDSDTAQIWETRSGVELMKLVGEQGFIRTIHFSPDGKRVAIGSVGAPARVHDCEICGWMQDLLALAKARVPRRFTSEEKQKFGVKDTSP